MSRPIISIFLWFFGMLIVTGIHAQVPGYLGKRASLGCRLYTNPGFPGSSNFRQPEAERIYLHTRHHLEADWVISRRASLGINGGWCRNGISEYTSVTQQEAHITIQSFSGGIHLRRYFFLRRGNIAPLGPYLEAQVAILHFIMRNPDGDFFHDGRTDLGSRNNLYFSVAWGRNYLLKDALLLSFGMQGGIVESNGWLGNIRASEYDYEVADRMRSSYRINFHIGVAGLLF